jgi:endonuclease-3
MAKRVVDEFNNKIPHNTKDLMTLAGVGNKTANVFMIEAEGANLMAVDTHVFRVSHRLGLSDAKTVGKTEEQLVKKLKDDLHIFHQSMVLFGRYICKAVSPDCDKCLFPNQCKTTKTFRV